MTEELVVRYGARTVGRLDGTAFCYDAGWLAGPDAFPISVSLPLSREPYGAPGLSWFANLLPEGTAREAVCARLGISIGNDLELLRAIGGECAGALTVGASDGPTPAEDRATYGVLDVRELVASRAAVPLLVGGAATRLSLAGAQNKVPVAMIGGRVHLPLAGTPSTHILKLPHARFPHLPLNEAWVMGLAARVEVGAAQVDVLFESQPPCLLVERYDRRESAGRVIRLHQEDFCQATGRRPEQKYEQEGGPSFAECAMVVTRASSDPLLDLQRLMRWQAFNAIVGNCDAHGKNLSLVYDGSRTRLAPFYDLLSTRRYAEEQRSRTAA